ncbi:response regulator [Niastella caeni]|uniref:Response regulator n=1 Tax=Niastella caeni TaxID=2569763 RepID=A0A4S8HRU9_9BACT|nr:response regulator [Niastella caeni]THU38247.1 response regulator [Niastella caeni]
MRKINSVLLIDDDEPTNFINKKILQSSGRVEVIHVANGGTEALRILSNNKNNLNNSFIPDVIFLDINMPAMDGWEFLIEFKKLENLKAERIIIVMLTTSLNPDDELKAKGIKEVYMYKNKPLTKDMIEEIINNNFSF